LDLPQKLQSLSQGLPYLSAEIFTALVFVLMIVLEIFLQIKKTNTAEKQTWMWTISIGMVFFLIYFTMQSWGQYEQPLLHYSKSIITDNHAQYVKLLIYVAAFLGLMHIKIWRYTLPAEFYLLLVFQLLGLQLLCVSNNFLIAYLSVEVVSVASYVMVAQSGHKKASEAAIKYAIFGGASTAIMLYGISLFYGITGHIHFDINETSRYLYQIDSKALGMVVLLVVAGFLFKLSAFPMHIWAPDVYQTTTTPVVSFLSVAPKIAAFLLLLRLVALLPEVTVQLLYFIALASIVFGNIAALRQQNVKRMLAYSGIAQIGFVLLTLALPNAEAIRAAYFYLFVYLFANMLLFFLIDIVQKDSPNQEYLMEHYAGLGAKNTLWGLVLVLVVVSLVGLPPTAGFSAKLLVFSVLWQGYQSSGSVLMLLVFVVGLLNTAISIYYYLRLPYFAFFKENNNQARPLSLTAKVFVLLLSLPIWYYFFRSDLLLNWLQSVI
jgi:NADH-quinone oxidoreductase subunit N